MNNNIPRICVIGGGLTGITTAYALSQRNLAVTLIAPKQTKPDARTTALLAHTVTLFQEYGIWDELSSKAFPLKVMRIVDGTKRLIRSQQADFNSSEIDLEAFGYNIKNQDALDHIKQKIVAQDNIEVIEGFVSQIEHTASGYVIELTDNDTKNCDIIVGADGRNSIVSKFMEQTPKHWDYPQSALVVDFEHTVSNQYVSTEFHRENGPFTIVPHSLNKAGLVWMENPDKVARLKDLSKTDLALEIEKNMQSFLGKITIVSEAQSFPISGMVAQAFGDEKHILLGEAAHVFPPIGAQGFNLGMRDLEAFIKLIDENPRANDIGKQYHRIRSNDINTRTMGADILNRSLLSSFIPVQLLRAAGLFALSNIAPLRKLVMKFGIAPKNT